jgi:serine/threonine-protein kinase
VLAYTATGGQGRVYKALDFHLDRLVALKEAPREALPSLVEEYLLLKRCQESHAVPTPYEVVDEPAFGMAFLVMEWVEGCSLLHFLNRSQVLPLSHVLPLLVQCCEALERLHQRQVLHRDIKPENILVTSSLLVIFLDLGISVLAQPEQSGMTSGLRGLGTPGYMAPEQVRGYACAASDVYSLGMTFTFLISKTVGSQQHLEALHSLVFAMTDPAPQRRPSLAEIRSVLHPLGRRTASPSALPPRRPIW